MAAYAALPSSVTRTTATSGGEQRRAPRRPPTHQVHHHAHQQQGEADPEEHAAVAVVGVDHVADVQEPGAERLGPALHTGQREDDRRLHEEAERARHREVEGGHRHRYRRAHDGLEEGATPPTGGDERGQEDGDQQVEGHRLPHQHRQRAEQGAPEPPAPRQQPHRQHREQDRGGLGVRARHGVDRERPVGGEHHRGGDPAERERNSRVTSR